MHAEITTEANGAVSRRSLLIGAVGAGVLPILPHHAFGRSVETPAMQEDERLMREAIAEAKLGDYPFGAVIVHDGKVLAKGRNLGKLEHDPTAHGEMVAIRQFLRTHGPAGR
jgi:tRNA(adenine34) deaminase